MSIAHSDSSTAAAKNFKPCSSPSGHIKFKQLYSKSSHEKAMKSNEASDVELNDSFADSLLGTIDLKDNGQFFFNSTAKKAIFQKRNSTMNSLC